MSKYSLVVCLMLVFFGLYESNSQTNKIQQKKFMIRHTVVFKFKPSVDSIAAQNFFVAAKRLATIPGVQNFESLRQTSKKNGYEFGLSMEFANETIYQQYNKDPLHEQFIQQYWVPSVAEFMEIDYEPLMN